MAKNQEAHMPTTLNVNEAKTHFSGLISEVERSLASFTIMRYGRPVARIVPTDRRFAQYGVTVLN